MRAFALDDFGSRGSVRDLPEPEVEAGFVRIRIAAAAVNPADLGILGGYYKDRMEHRFPLVPGLELAGTVDAVGSGVDDWRVGDEVFGGLGKMFWGAGSMAEYATASALTLARRPSLVDLPFAASLTIAGVSALLSVDALQVASGDILLVIGAAGGVGGFAVQLAVQAGAQVIAVTRGVNERYVRELGAAEFIDYGKEDVFATVRRAHPEGIAGLLDTIGDKVRFSRMAELVREGGRVASMLGSADADDLGKRSVTGVNVVATTTRSALDRLAEQAVGGALKRPEIKTFGLERAGDALIEMGGGHVRGKLVVTPGEGA